MDEGHLVVNVTSYAFQYAWGGIVYNPSGPPLETRDIWREDVRDKPIAVKKALALVNTLKAGKSVLSNCRVDAHVDCLALIQAWERQGGKSTQLNDALKELFQTLLAQNISLCLQFVPSPHNQADALSRVLSDKDCMLAPEPWKELENLFGPHTFDLMAFDSNAQIGCSSSPLPHFTPFPTPGSRGVNVFAQDEASQEDTYVFPPFILVLFSVFSTRPCSRSPLWFQNCLLYHIGGLLFKQGHLILSSWAIKLITISCYFHLCTTFFPHVLYLAICMLSGLPTRFRLSFL